MKTSVYSHYFPQISVGSTRSPYFRSGRYGKRAAEGQVRQETAREQRQRVQSATVSLASGTKGQTMDSAICSERTANETDDGWLAKPAPYRRNGDHRVNRRVRERRWKKKTRMWDRRQPNGSNSDISTGCLVPATQLDEADIRIPDTAHEVRGDTAAERISTVFEGEDRGTNQRVYGASTKNTKPGEVSSYFTCSTVQEVAEAANKKKGRGRSVTAGKSVIPWPPLTSKTFGLIQEELENDTVSLFFSYFNCFYVIHKTHHPKVPSYSSRGIFKQDPGRCGTPHLSMTMTCSVPDLELGSGCCPVTPPIPRQVSLPSSFISGRSANNNNLPAATGPPSYSSQQAGTDGQNLGWPTTYPRNGDRNA